jgi:hypothetical protein
VPLGNFLSLVELSVISFQYVMLIFLVVYFLSSKKNSEKNLLFVKKEKVARTYAIEPIRCQISLENERQST